MLLSSAEKVINCLFVDASSCVVAVVHRNFYSEVEHSSLLSLSCSLPTFFHFFFPPKI